MEHGFLGNQASFMLDIVVCALVIIVPALFASIFLVKVKRRYLWHRNIQLLLGIVLLIAVGAFEIDLQIVHDGWESIVNKREPPHSAEDLESIRRVLRVHLVFAISTPFFWAATIVLAWRRFPSPPTPSQHSRLHKTLGWISAIDISLTSVTGLIFYYVAFMS